MMYRFLTMLAVLCFLVLCAVGVRAAHSNATSDTFEDDESKHLPGFIRVIIKDDSGRFLVMKTKYGSKSYWNFVGGKIEENEKPVDAAQRETLEETGILLTDYRSLGEFIADVEGTNWKGYVYLVEGYSNEVTNKESNKCSELGFKTYDEIMSLKDVSDVTKTIFHKFILSDTTSKKNPDKALNIQAIYSLLRDNGSLTKQYFAQLKGAVNGCTKAQLGSLAAQLELKRDKNATEKECIEYLKHQDSEIAKYLIALTEKPANINDQNNRLVNIVSKVNNNVALEPEEINFVFNGYDKNQISDTYMATLLMTISYKGLSDQNTMEMTYVMRDSGQIYDYRNNPALNSRKIIRRYPTGGLSEKIALIMPSVIVTLAKKYPIASNFLVAKSLSYTGGTWDKLNTIPGFTFPRQGEETIRVMSECNVAMSVTNDGFNSLDRKLYQLRGATGTVESIPLIIASIASKQLAIPADFLLMDVRYGSGAFVETFTEGKKLGDGLMKVLHPKMNSGYFLTEMEQPNGMSIGNELEIIEAITIMKNDIGNTMFDSRGLKEQRDLVVKMLSKILHEVFPSIKRDSFEQEINMAFEQGEVIESFKKLLLCHKVPSDIVYKLIDDPLSLIKGYDSLTVTATDEGSLRYVDQKALGRLVNFELKTGLNEYIKTKNNGAGVILKVRLGDEVKKGQPICTIFANTEYLDKNQEFIRDYIDNSFTVAK